MAIPAPTAAQVSAVRDRGYHLLRVRRIVSETADAISIVLDVPPDQRDAFRYAAGQFCTFRVPVGDQLLVRCYSMSSSPAVDPELQVTVKRVPGGPVSNWLNDHLSPGDIVEVSPPSGLFRLDEGEGDMVAFCAGSGITPVFSILKTALATSSRRITLLYANRDPDSVIFGAELASLADQHRDRLRLISHLDSEDGYVSPTSVHRTIDGSPAATYFVCGPGPFMDVVEQALLERGVEPDHIHIERFVTAEPSPPPAAVVATDPAEVTIELNGRVGTTPHRPGSTVLQTARELGMAPPFSCESGNCATCMAKLIEGDAPMRCNNALTAEEVADGWILTCQAVPMTGPVHVVYE